jgi:opacity protein-like surface antigen
MKKLATAMALVAALSGTARAADTHEAQAQVRQVVERFRTAVIAHDQAALEALFVPEGGAWFEVLGEGAFQRIKAEKPDLSRVHADSYRHFAAFVGGSKQAIEERFDNVRIHTDGAVASVYFDFVFLVDGKPNNVGSETWQLVHTNEGWRISAMAYSDNPPAGAR